MMMRKKEEDLMASDGDELGGFYWMVRAGKSVGSWGETRTRTNSRTTRVGSKKVGNFGGQI